MGLAFFRRRHAEKASAAQGAKVGGKAKAAPKAKAVKDKAPAPAPSDADI